MRSAVEIVEILDTYLKENGLSRKQFCEHMGISDLTVSVWKFRNVLPSVEIAGKIAKFMNVSLDWLVFGEMLEEANNLIFNTHLYELAKKYRKILLILDKVIEEEIILRNNT